jgi:hypothetical protein
LNAYSQTTRLEDAEAGHNRKSEDAEDESNFQVAPLQIKGSQTDSEYSAQHKGGKSKMIASVAFSTAIPAGLFGSSPNPFSGRVSNNHINDRA